RFRPTPERPSEQAFVILAIVRHFCHRARHPCTRPPRFHHERKSALDLTAVDFVSCGGLSERFRSWRTDPCATKLLPPLRAKPSRPRPAKSPRGSRRCWARSPACSPAPL